MVVAQYIQCLPSMHEGPGLPKNLSDSNGGRPWWCSPLISTLRRIGVSRPTWSNLKLQVSQDYTETVSQKSNQNPSKRVGEMAQWKVFMWHKVLIVDSQNPHQRKLTGHLAHKVTNITEDPVSNKAKRTNIHGCPLTCTNTASVLNCFLAPKN